MYPLISIYSKYDYCSVIPFENINITILYTLPSTDQSKEIEVVYIFKVLTVISNPKVVYHAYFRNSAYSKLQRFFGVLIIEGLR